MTSKKPSGASTGIKTLVMVGSLVATIGGWGILAAGQVGTAAAAPVPVQAQLSQSNVRQVSPPANQPTVRQANPATVAPSNQVRPVTRSRSSR